MQKRNTEGIGKIRLPLTQIFYISIQNIRIRFTRSLLSILSVVLGIAFLVFLLETMMVFQVYSQRAAVDVPFTANQYWLVIISLLVCAVSIANSMLIAVYERYKEIGTMKCLGALDRHVFLLFIIESSLIGLLGGVIGFSFGEIAALINYGLRFGFDIVFGVPVIQKFLAFIFSIFMAFVISIVATLYPAYRAAKANPVEALRFEI